MFPKNPFYLFLDNIKHFCKKHNFSSMGLNILQKGRKTRKIIVSKPTDTCNELLTKTPGFFKVILRRFSNHGSRAILH